MNTSINYAQPRQCDSTAGATPASCHQSGLAGKIFDVLWWGTAKIAMGRLRTHLDALAGKLAAAAANPVTQWLYLDTKPAICSTDLGAFRC